MKNVLSLFLLCGILLSTQPASAGSRRVLTVVLNGTKSSGLPWDLGGDMGDPFVKIDGVSYIDQGGLSKCKNQQRCEIVVTIDYTEVEVRVYDEDGGITGEHDYVGSCRLRIGQTCQAGASTVTLN